MSKLRKHQWMLNKKLCENPKRTDYSPWDTNVLQHVIHYRVVDLLILLHSVAVDEQRSVSTRGSGLICGLRELHGVRATGGSLGFRAQTQDLGQSRSGL